MRTKVDEYFNIKIDGKTVKVWHSRKFNEVIFLHIPRFIFLTGGIYSIYIINVRQAKEAQRKGFSVSHRQESLNNQLTQIENVLQPALNIFEPGK